MDIVDLLKDGYAFNGDPLHRKALDEIERLRKDKAELLEALKFYSCDCQCLDGCSIADCGDIARKAIDKATGGK